jgi:hypothetical protein
VAERFRLITPGSILRSSKAHQGRSRLLDTERGAETRLPMFLRAGSWNAVRHRVSPGNPSTDFAVDEATELAWLFQGCSLTGDALPFAVARQRRAGPSQRGCHELTKRRRLLGFRAIFSVELSTVEFPNCNEARI